MMELGLDMTDHEIGRGERNARRRHADGNWDYGMKDRLTDRQTDRQTDRHRCKQDRQIDRQKNR